MNALKKAIGVSTNSHCPKKTQDSDFHVRAKCLGRDVVPADCDSSLLIKINISDTHDEMMEYLPSQKFKCTVLKFSIDGSKFCGIDGNNRDAKVANSLKAYSDSEEMKISITTGNVSIVHTVERQFKNNFLRCINEGMLSFYTMPDCGDRIDEVSGKTFKELLGDGFGELSPTCCQFTKFLKYGYTDDTKCSQAKFALKKIERIDQLPLFSIIQIRLLDKFVHEFLHISNGVCLEKLGCSNIAFAKIDHIVEFYGRCLNSKRLMVYELIENPGFVS